MKNKTSFPLYPFLFAIYPALNLYSRNARSAAFTEVLRPMAVCLALAAVSLLAAQLVFRNRAKAGIWTSVFVMMFLSYGHLLRSATRLLHKFDIDWDPASHFTAALIVWIVVLALCTALLATTKRKLGPAVQFLVVMSVAVTALALFHIGVVAASGGLGRKPDTGGWEKWIDGQRRQARNFGQQPGRPKPDIYYIVLDMYGRDDVLRKDYHFDNSAFIDSLTKRGFYVARRSRCNYACTQFSLPSSLNYDYMDSLMRAAKDQSTQYNRKAVLNSRLARILQDKGYKYVFLTSTCRISSECPYADILPSSGAVVYTELERWIVQRSVLNFLSVSNADATLRDQTLFQLDQLGQVPRIKAPTFTFAHVFCPHDPWVFDRKGNMPNQTATENPEATRAAYVEQLRYLNDRMLQVVDKILANSPTPPIIVIQADHGPLDPTLLSRWLGSGDIRDPDGKIRLHAWTRVGILNAYYLPGEAKNALYDTITPVNTWRIVLDHYFGAHLGLLKDATYCPTRGWVGRGSVFELKDFLPYVEADPAAVP